MLNKNKTKRSTRRAIELFRDNRFSKRVVKNKKSYDRKRDKKIVNETESITPVNSMGSSSTTQGPIQTFDPLLQIGKRKIKNFSIFKRKSV
jgi:hypothetical protein